MRDKVKARLWHQAYYAKHKERLLAYHHELYTKNKEEYQAKERQYHKSKYKALRLQIFNALGNRCSCCGESQYEFLTIDHINSDGAKERKDIGTGIDLFKHIIAQGITKERYQILCQNCNTAKYYHKGCPHKKKVLV